jgi:hypothetical protein
MYKRKSRYQQINLPWGRKKSKQTGEMLGHDRIDGVHDLIDR